MENVIAYLIIMGAVSCGMIIGNLVSSLIQVRIFTGKKFIKKIFKRSSKAVMKETEKMIQAISSMEE